MTEAKWKGIVNHVQHRRMAQEGERSTRFRGSAETVEGDSIRLQQFCHRTRDAISNKVNRLLVFEIGAGMSIPTVPNFGENHTVYLIRINTDEAKLPCGVDCISSPMTGLAGLQLLQNAISS